MTRTAEGGCHCGNVRFRVVLQDNIQVVDCNCTVCAKSGNAHVIVPSSAFTLLQGEDKMTDYRFNTGVARHRFCATCGVKSFYHPRSNPDGIAVTFRCLDGWHAMANVAWESFNGLEWETSMAASNLGERSAAGAEPSS